MEEVTLLNGGASRLKKELKKNNAEGKRSGDIKQVRVKNRGKTTTSSTKWRIVQSSREEHTLFGKKKEKVEEGEEGQKQEDKRTRPIS